MVGIGSAFGVGVSAPFSLTIPESTLTKKVAISYPKPGYLQPLFDFSMGYPFPMKITQVSLIGSTMWPTVDYGNYVQGGYPNRQAWNVGGTILKSGNQHLLNGNTYEFIRKTAGTNYYSLWSNTDSNKIWQFPKAGEVRVFDVAANTSTSWFTLASMGYSGVTDMSVGEFEGAIDDNDVFTILMFTHGGIRHNVLVNLQTKAKIWDKTDADFNAPEGNVNYLRISADGTQILRGISTGTADASVFDRATGGLIRSGMGTGSHSDIVVSPDGTNRYVSRLGNPPLLYNIATGVVSDLFTQSAYTAAFGADVGQGHTTRMINKPGWEHISLIDGSVDEYIYQVKLDGSKTVQKFCHSRCNPTGSFGAHSSPNRDGTKSFFESNWGVANGNSEMYVCEVPTQAELAALGIFL